ncbi:MAG: hypothetical protein JWQ95_5714 [Sphaerisporangium sp.]|jgi:hypothetical protein|nr:hypothetical protein [Sphaerisporangium sp.]
MMASQTRRLLACGLLAGPVFLTVWLAQALTREGFDPAYHPLSLLSLGELGWIQIGNFVVTGLLMIGFAAGLRRTPAGRVAAVLMALSGAGLIMAGVFTTDPGAGFPPGAPTGAPPHVSWHGVVHEVGFAVVTLSWIAACVVLARRFTGRARWLCVAAPVLAVAMSAWPDLDSLSLRLVAGTAIQFALTAYVAARVTASARAAA